MADALGLVYQGADGTGAAFKAPWTSYDPYKAEVQMGEKLASLEQAKREKEEKDKEEILKRSSLAPPNWAVDNLSAITEINNAQQDYLTQLAASGQLEKARVESVAMQSMNKGYKQSSDAQHKGYMQAASRINNAPGAYREEGFRNLAVYSDPALATEADYPEVKKAYEETYGQVKSILGRYSWVTEGVIRAQARVATRDKINDLLEVPVDYPDKNWWPTALSMAKQATNVQGSPEGGLNVTTKTFTPEQANDVLKSIWRSDSRLRNDKRRSFMALPEEERSKYKDVEDYFVQDYAPKLVDADRVAKKPGSFNVNVGDGTGGTTYSPGPNQALEIPVGIQDTETGKTPGTAVYYGETSPLNVSGILGEISGTQLENTFSVSEDPDERGIVKRKRQTKPADFRVNDRGYVVVAKRDVELRDGTVIPKGSLILKEALDRAKAGGYEFDGTELEFEAVFKGSSGKNIYFVPATFMEPKVKQQYTQKKVDYVEMEPPPANIYEALKIQVKKPASKSNATTQTPAAQKPASPAAPAKKEINRADIPAKAKAAGYSVEEYTKMLKEKGITIK